ncbi:uncharacterized protein [Coffea arabica]|uniref:GAG-pre-integrase domain-containing protein n=1 Tax=Coffea arabica TaxID=13443 RepID=A0ABM4X7D5_COFAR
MFRDPSSPYFLNSADYTNASLVPTLLDGDNYQRWKRNILNSLRSKNKIPFVNGELPQPKVGSREALFWSKCDGLVLSWLINSISPDLHNSITYHDSARELWVDLEERFSQNNEPRIYEIRKDIALSTQGTASVTTFYSKLKALWDELSAYSNPPNCSCGGLKEWLAERDKERSHQFLMGLDEKFKTIRSQILATEPLPSLNRIFNMVKTEEKQLSLLSPHDSDGAGAFYVQQPRSSSGRRQPSQYSSEMLRVRRQQGQPRQNGNQSSKQPKLRCDHCNKAGHTMDRCWELIGYPNNWQSSRKNPTAANVCSDDTTTSSNSTTPINGLTAAQYEQLLSLLKSDKNADLVNFAGNDLRSRKLIGVGKERDGLYYFTTDYNESRHGKANTATGSAVLWHQRLGHPSHDRLASIPNFSHIRSDKICQECTVCPLAKASRQVFSPSIHKSMTPFHLVHIDIWGPYQTPSSSGGSFFLNSCG